MLTLIKHTPLPLPAVAKLSLPDPLARASAVRERSPYLNWSERKADVLKEFTVSGSISLAAGLMDADEKDGEEQSVPLAKARQRLQALESSARGVSTVEMSQSEIIRRVEKMQRDLQRSWENNQRVTSLKICIQASKLLTQAQVPQFYPSMWTMVTEVSEGGGRSGTALRSYWQPTRRPQLLDTFGHLVFGRLKSMADEEYGRMGGKGPLPDSFTARDVGAETRETCRNWMYKTSCIRELLPRL